MVCMYEFMDACRFWLFGTYVRIYVCMCGTYIHNMIAMCMYTHVTCMYTYIHTYAYVHAHIYIQT